MTRIYLPLLIAFGLASPPLVAGELCAALRQGDASLGDAPERCMTSLMETGGEQVSCRWAFAYRAPEALARFEDWLGQTEACLGPDTALPEDQSVNHPDSYALHRFDAPDARISLSLKDKASLQKTYIFLTIAPHS